MDPTAGNDDELTGQAPLAVGIGGDRCTNCGTPLVSDQRYCLNCGQRRGKARFSFDSLAASSAAAKEAAEPAPPPEKHPRTSSGISLIAGVATLLIAIGVGFLLGHGANNKQVTTPSQAAQVIKIQGGGGGGGSGGGGRSKNHKKQAATTIVAAKGFTAPQLKLTKKTIEKVNSAASGVLGSGAGKLSNNPTVQPGQSCSGGAGCQGGKFTGNFFGQ